MVSSGFTTPPQKDFQSCSRLMTDQASHLVSLARWSGDQCGNADGLEGLLSPLTGPIHQVSQLFTEKLGQCQRGMQDVSGKITLTAQDYARADQAAISAINGIYPSALPHFPDIGTLHLPNVGNFTDQAVSLTEPSSAQYDTARNIEHELDLLRKKLLFGGPLAVAQKVFQFFTGQNLVELLLDPLVGDYGRLLYLHDAYDELGSGLYTVAATIRKGSWALGDQWTGDAATNFDSYMFRWSMGIGGLGDAAKVVAKDYHDGYVAVSALVFSALYAINKLMDTALAQLAKEGGKIVAVDATIEVLGLGPEDPVADVIAGVFTVASTAYTIYRIISVIITAINAIEKIFHDISESVKAIHSAVTAVTNFFDGPLPSIGSLINDVEQRGFSFEQDKGWSPSLGAARVALLPSA